MANKHAEPKIKDLASMQLKQEQNINKRLDELSNKIESITKGFVEKLAVLENKSIEMEKSNIFTSSQYES